uniref:Uncharacterized protein n=1 Tax=Arundo donax TaxID=35708 RepID=A0A0A9GH61_ARUDO
MTAPAMVLACWTGSRPLGPSCGLRSRVIPCVVLGCGARCATPFAVRYGPPELG